MKRNLTPLAAACLLAATSLPLNASSYSSVVVFGDSLSDAGWTADLGGPDGARNRATNRTGPTYLPGTGESIGRVTPMILGDRLGLDEAGLEAANQGGNNWAVGGYNTGQILETISGPTGYLASTGGRADPNALYYLTGGGNDFLQFLITTPETAKETAGRLVGGLQTLQQAGARYIMVWLVPDVGKTPILSSTPLSDSVSQLSAVFNGELVRLLPTVDAEVIPLNIPLFLSEVIADPGRYGLAIGVDQIHTCFSSCGVPSDPVYGLNGTNPDPSKLLFNDFVHPTVAGHTLIADYAYSLLAAPWEVSLLPEMAHGTLRSHQDQLRAQWQADWETWQAVGQWRPFVSSGGQRLDFNTDGGSSDGNGYSLNFGGSYRLNDAWRVGLAAGLYEQDLEAGAADSDYNLRSYLGTAFAQYQQNRWWGELAASIGYLDYDDLKRKFDIGPGTRSEKGDTNGDLWSLSGRVGYDIAQSVESQWHLSPFVNADYARVEVDGYSEEGTSSSALSFGDQKRNSKRLGVGLQGLFDLSQQTRLFGEVAMEREYEDDATDVDMSLRSLSTVGYTLDGYTPDDKTWRASVGISHKLAPGMSLRGAYTYRNADGQDQQGINLSLAWDL